MQRGLKRTARYLGIGGVASILFGVTILLWPGISLVSLALLFGAFAFTYGTLALGAGLSLLAHKSTEWVPYMLAGAAGIVIGVITFLHPGITVLTLTYLIGAWALVNGVLAILGAIDLWNEIDGALWLAIGGALSIVFATVVAIQPGAGLLAILWMIGTLAILAGSSQLGGAYLIHRFRKESMATRSAMQSNAA